MCLFDAFLVVESLRQLIAESSGTEGVSDGVLEARGVVEWEWTFGYRRLPCFLTISLHILGFHRILCQKLCSIDVLLSFTNTRTSSCKMFQVHSGKLT